METQFDWSSKLRIKKKFNSKKCDVSKAMCVANLMTIALFGLVFKLDGLIVLNWSWTTAAAWL